MGCFIHYSSAPYDGVYFSTGTEEAMVSTPNGGSDGGGAYLCKTYATQATCALSYALTLGSEEGGWNPASTASREGTGFGACNGVSMTTKSGAPLTLGKCMEYCEHPGLANTDGLCYPPAGNKTCTHIAALRNPSTGTVDMRTAPGPDDTIEGCHLFFACDATSAVADFPLGGNWQSVQDASPPPSPPPPSPPSAQARRVRRLSNSSDRPSGEPPSPSGRAARARRLTTGTYYGWVYTFQNLNPIPPTFVPQYIGAGQHESSWTPVTLNGVPLAASKPLAACTRSLSRSCARSPLSAPPYDPLDAHRVARCTRLVCVCV
jgi:hypothetical protein